MAWYRNWKLQNGGSCWPLRWEDHGVVGMEDKSKETLGTWPGLGMDLVGKAMR